MGSIYDIPVYKKEQGKGPDYISLIQQKPYIIDHTEWKVHSAVMILFRFTFAYYKAGSEPVYASVFSNELYNQSHHNDTCL